MITNKHHQQHSMASLNDVTKALLYMDVSLLLTHEASHKLVVK